jgi:hypothetical protein
MAAAKMETSPLCSSRPGSTTSLDSPQKQATAEQTFAASSWVANRRYFQHCVTNPASAYLCKVLHNAESLALWLPHLHINHIVIQVFAPHLDAAASEQDTPSQWP